MKNRMRLAVVINAKAGAAQAQDDALLRERLTALSAARGLQANVEFAPGDEIPSATARALAKVTSGEADAVVAGGGDGSIGTVAGLLADTGIPFGVLPLGTFNHFGRELGIPRTLEGALDVIAAGRTAQIDAAEVNGHVFINNSSIGLYPFLVLDRDRRRRDHGLAKWTAATLASVRMLWRFPVRRLSVTAAGETAPHRTPLLFVGNNEYSISWPKLGARARLDGGELWLCISRRQGRLGLIWLACRAIFGLADARDLAAVCTSSAEIRSRASRLPVALDGDVRIMRPPLCYRSRPGALRVFVPEVSPPPT